MPGRCERPPQPKQRTKSWGLACAAIDHRVCMLTVRCQRRPDRGIPWVEVIQREYHRNFVTPSTLHKRISLIQCQIPIVRRHPGYGKAKQLSLPIFRDSTSDNAITYDDWRSDVDNYVQEGHPTRLIRDSHLVCTRGTPLLHCQNGNG